MSEARKSRRASILRRITLLSWLVAVLSLAVFAVFTILQLRRTKVIELEGKSHALAQKIEQSISQHMADNNCTPVIMRCLEVLESDPSLRYVVITLQSGKVLTLYVDTKGRPRWNDDLAATGGTTPVAGANDSVSVAADALGGRVWHYRHTASEGATVVGDISLGMSMQEYDDSIHAIYRNAGTTGGVVLIIGVVAAYSVARNLIRPLRALQSFAHKVTGGALNARANVDVAGEIGDLAESMNRMVESLEQSNVKIRDSMKSQASLREKEILLREIHHRVKNNMQILTSLLRLQTRQADSQELREVLQESEARIRSMGLLHEKLYQSESVSVIDMHGYLRTLTGELMRMNTPQGTRREIKLNVQGVGLGLDTALPCGLIITELVTNALKYAFHGRAEGIIYVSLGTSVDGNYQLVVWDNGVGMDPKFDISKATSLGMRLVKMLTDQLNGSLSLDTTQGTRVMITFRESLYETRL